MKEADELERKLKEIQKQLDETNSKKASISKGLAKGRTKLTKAINKLANLEKDKKN